MSTMVDVTCYENEFQPHRRIVFEYEFGESSTFSYLMGTTKPIYIDMASGQISPVRCLFLGSGDIRNILYLIHTSPTISDWEFDLVDNNPSVVARNLLFLQILNDETVSIDILWNIWYDFVLNKKVYLYLQQLIQKMSVSNLGLIHEAGRPVIAKVFKEWLMLFESVVKEKVCKQRHEHLKTFDESIASILVNENQTIISEAKKEIKRYIADGTTELMKSQEYVNITMLQSSSGIYTGYYGMYPYQGYIPIETSEEQEEFRMVTAQKLNPLLTYCKYKLDQWVKTYRQRRKKTKWNFWYGDALSVGLFYMPLIEFDLIHTSNLCDHIGMLNLLVTCTNLLRQRPWSRIVTQSMQCRKTFANFTDYISQLFNGIELSWLPSLLGLICECTSTIELQIWRLAANGQVEPSLRLDGTDVHVIGVLDKLAERCFYTHLTKPEASKGIGHSTPLTYYLLLRQYCQRCCVHPDESFEYLFQRTCDRFRAYAASLHALRDVFSNNNVYMYTLDHHSSTRTDTLLACQIQTPALQIVIMECDEKTMYTLLTAIRASTFKETTKTSVTNDDMSYDLSTGTMVCFSDRQRQIKFHFIDDFIFKLAAKSAQDKDALPEFYMNPVNNAQVQFIVSTSFSPLFQTALLIDAHTWFPFAKFQLKTPITICSKSAAKALAIRDAVLSCCANILDRQIYYTTNDKKTSTIQIVNAYETTSSYHVLIKIQTQQSSWTHTQNLILSEHVLLLNIKFSHSIVCSLRLAFACPLDLHQSKFQANIDKGTLDITLSKMFIRESVGVLFDSTTAKRWPPPRLANGRLLDIRMDLPAPLAVGGYDSETMMVSDALTEMFTLLETPLLQRQSDKHLYRDADFDLRETLKFMYLQTFCGRQRIAWYSPNVTRSLATSNDIRTYADILFLYEGMYNYCGRPILAVSYLDTTEITDANVIYLTQYIKDLIKTELGIYASNIAQAKSVSRSLPSTFDVFEIKASKEELNLMRQFLIQNRAKTKGSHRKGLQGPWHASFVEPLRMDPSSRLRSSALTRESGINFESVLNMFQMRTNFDINLLNTNK